MPNSFFPRAQLGFLQLASLFLLLLIAGIGIYFVQGNSRFISQAALATPAPQLKSDPKLGVRLTNPNLIDRATAMGASKIRISVESADFFYNQGGTSQKAYFDSATQIFKSAKSDNLQLIIVIKPSTPINNGDFQSRIDLLSQYLNSYNNIVFELGNEPNGKNSDGQNFWNGDYNSFADFIKNSSTIIRQKWPSAPIIIGALDLQGKINGSSEEVARQDLNLFLDALGSKVNLNNFDFAIHSYNNLNWFNTIYNLEKAELNKRNLNPKLWLTETGVNLNQGDNPQHLIDIIKEAESKNDIKGVLIHSFDSTDGYQLWDTATNRPTASYNLVQSFVGNNPASVASANQSSMTNATDKSCSNNPLSPPTPNQVWHAFCNEADYATGHFICSSNADCPQNTVQTDSGINAATSNQCVQFKEGPRCIQLRLFKSDSGQNLYDPKDLSFDTPNDTYVKNPANLPFGRVGLGQSQGKEGDNPGSRSDFSLFLSDYDKMIARIKEDTRVKELLAQAEFDKQQELLAAAEKATQEAREANEAWLNDKTNAELAKKASDATKKAADSVAAAEAIRKLAKLEQMLAGKTTEQCLKADLGIRPWLMARRLKARGEDTREDGSPGEKVNRYLRLHVCSGKDSKLKWRVATEGNDNTQGDENENSMERILHLHGDSETAPYPTPKYPFTEIQGRFTTLVGQNEDEIRFALDKYIRAAKAGQAVIESAPAIPAEAGTE